MYTIQCDLDCGSLDQKTLNFPICVHSLHSTLAAVHKLHIYTPRDLCWRTWLSHDQLHCQQSNQNFRSAWVSSLSVINFVKWLMVPVSLRFRYFFYPQYCSLHCLSKNDIPLVQYALPEVLDLSKWSKNASSSTKASLAKDWHAAFSSHGLVKEGLKTVN